ncbi:putative uncharacterized protein C1orf196 [Parus major]|uniref:putative uncharacterized protein C1orf196 n=1 Tax=Parus major TaxID=9157 RepID=UPI00077135E2|nr:putative uncharacterized protein C1orf196 [Parus major]
MTNTRDRRAAMDSPPLTSSPPAGPVTFSQVFGQQCQLMEAAVESLHSLNDQISHFIVNKSKTLDEDEDAFLPSEKESLKSAMVLMRHLLMDAQAVSLAPSKESNHAKYIPFDFICTEFWQTTDLLWTPIFPCKEMNSLAARPCHHFRSVLPSGKRCLLSIAQI